MLQIIDKCFDFRSSSLVEAFTRDFPGRSLPLEMSQFSFPTQLREAENILSHPSNQVSLGSSLHLKELSFAGLA